MLKSFRVALNLIFSILSASLIFSCKKASNSEVVEVEVARAVAHNDFSEKNTGQNDDFGEEEDKIAEAIAMLENQQEQNKIEELFFCDDEASLKFFEYDTELFLLDKNAVAEGGKRELTHVSGSEVQRSFYDEKLRLIKNEFWSVKSASDYNLKKVEQFEYDSEEFLPKEKSVMENGFLTVYNYQPASRTILQVQKKHLKNEQSKKDVLVYSKKYSYDSENRLLSEESTEYEYADEKYSKIKDKITRKSVYSYHFDDIPPDLSYYENGRLKNKTSYTSEKGTYSTQIYFDNNLSVFTEYKNSVPVREAYLANGKIVREKDYE